MAGYWSAPITPTEPVIMTALLTRARHEGSHQQDDPDEGSAFDGTFFEGVWAQAVANQVFADNTGIVGWFNGAIITGALGNTHVHYSGTISKISGSVSYATVLHNSGFWTQLPPGGPWDTDPDGFGVTWGYDPDGLTAQYLSEDATPTTGGGVAVRFVNNQVSWNDEDLPVDTIMVKLGGTQAGASLDGALTRTEVEPGSFEISIDYTWPGTGLVYDEDDEKYHAVIETDVSSAISDEIVTVDIESIYNSEVYPFGGEGAGLLNGRSMSFYTQFTQVVVRLAVELPAFRYWVPTPGIKVLFPDRVWRTVGTAQRPLYIRTATGEWAEYPGRDAPVSVKTPNGWRQLL
jgi:hypothetical protein